MQTKHPLIPVMFAVCVSLLFAVARAAKAQETVFSEDFEAVTAGQLPAGWTKYGTGVFGVADAAAGNLNRKSLLISSTTPSDKTSVTTLYAYFVIQTTPGYTYSFSSDIYDNSATTATISIYWYPSADGSGSSVSSVESAMSADSASLWKNLLLKAAAPAGAYSAKCRLNFKVPKPAGAYSIYYDSVTVLATEGFIPENTVGSLNAVITEAAPSESSGDWMEFFVMEAGNTCGMKVYEGKVLVKEFQWLKDGATYFVGADVAKGDYILLRFNSNTDDERTVKNGVITFYTSDSGLTGTDNVLSLRRRPTDYVDVCAFSDQNGSLSSDNKRELGNAMLAGVWKPNISTTTATAAELEANMVGKWASKAGSAIVRKTKVVAGSRLPTLNSDVTASKDAWEIKTTQSAGRGYTFIVIDPIALKIYDDAANPNPFDSSKHAAKISFYVADRSVKTLTVFDVRGRQVVRLINQDRKLDSTSLGGIGSDIVYWDGKDSSGNRVPTGVYIVCLEAVDAAYGEVSKAYATIGVFRGK